MLGAYQVAGNSRHFKIGVGSSMLEMFSPYNMYEIDRSATASERYLPSGAPASSFFTGDVNRGPSPPPPPRQRSHRPRGCRGGRKNRKNKDEFGSFLSPATDKTDAPLSQRQNFPPSPLKGDLSPYQHVHTSKSAWDFDNHTLLNSAQKQQIQHHRQHQLLPPPVPSALFARHHYGTGPAEALGSGLKMLPSFDEQDDGTKGHVILPPPLEGYFGRLSAPPLPHLDWNAARDEATLDTAESSCSDDSDSHHSWGCNSKNRPSIVLQQQQQQQPAFESGSLFVTSPRSFLLGDAIRTTVDSSPSSASAEHRDESNIKIINNNSHTIPVW